MSSSDAAWFHDPAAVAEAARPSDACAAPPDVPGYSELIELHAGGQGVVYLARCERTGERIALKVLHAESRSRAAVLRFEREVELVTRLDHPNIVRVLESGTTTHGRPFLAMEYVRGQPLDEYVLGSGASDEALHAPIGRDRALELFLRICDAVGFAHRHGVIHRDLKPSNIRVDEHGEPRVLDFGLARLTEADGDKDVFSTATSLFLGTPAYAAPEQLAVGDGVDTRTDVYALGVILYQLVTGRLPYRSGASMGEIIAGIANHDVVNPREIASTPRDLEAVILKAIAKQPGERYQTVNALADDVQAVLRGEPTSARPLSRRDEWLLFLRRNWIVASLMTLIILLSMAFAVTAGLLAVRAEDARQQAVQAQRHADLESTRAQAWLDFLSSVMFSGHAVQDPEQQRVILALLDEAHRRLNAQPNDDPVVQAALHEALGRTLYAVNAHERAAEHLDAALQLDSFADSPLKRLQAQLALSHSLLEVRGVEAAKPVVETIVEELRAGPAPCDAVAAALASTLGRTLSRAHGQNELGESLLRATWRATAGCDDIAKERILLALDLTEVLLRQRKELDEAEELTQWAAETAMLEYGPAHFRTLRARAYQAIILEHRERFPEAIAIMSDVAARSEESLGPLDEQTIQSLRYLGQMQLKNGDMQEAQKTLEQCVERCEKLFGSKDPRTRMVAELLGQSRKSKSQ